MIRRYASYVVVYLLADDLRSIASLDVHPSTYNHYLFLFPRLARLLVSAGEDNDFDSTLCVLQLDEGHGLTVLGIDLAYPVNHSDHSYFVPCHSLVDLAQEAGN